MACDIKQGATIIPEILMVKCPAIGLWHMCETTINGSHGKHYCNKIFQLLLFDLGNYFMNLLLIWVLDLGLYLNGLDVYLVESNSDSDLLHRGIVV